MYNLRIVLFCMYWNDKEIDDYFFVLITSWKITYENE